MTRTGSAGKDLFTFTMPMPAGATALDSLPISVTVTYTCDGVTYTTSTGSLRLPMQATTPSPPTSWWRRGSGPAVM